ncbi:MAG: ribosome recycling factor [Deltaproteobacteria bacterium]
MNEAIFAQLQKEMDGSLGALRKELSKLRTGRASTALLEHIVVEYYGATTPLNQLATLSAPEPRLLIIQPFDRSAMGEIERAILKSDLGLTPNNDGKVIRIPIPQLTEERRKDLVKHVKRIAEEYRVSVRQHRRDAIERLKETEKKKEITADDSKHGQERVQKVTDDYIARIERIVKAKEEEVMEV